MLEFYFTFRRTYEVAEVGEWPGAGNLGVPVKYIPRPKNRAEHEGEWIKFTAKSGKAWIGVLAFGYASPPAFSRIVSTPDPEKVCVVANGGGYIVNVEQPDGWERVPIWPALDIRSVPEHALLVFADFIRLAAYGIDGWAWESPRLCWDELKITRVTSATIEGTGLDPFDPGAATRFAVDLRTGRSLYPSPPGMPG